MTFDSKTVGRLKRLRTEVAEHRGLALELADIQARQPVAFAWAKKLRDNLSDLTCGEIANFTERTEDRLAHLRRVEFQIACFDARQQFVKSAESRLRNAISTEVANFCREFSLPHIAGQDIAGRVENLIAGCRERGLQLDDETKEFIA